MNLIILLIISFLIFFFLINCSSLYEKEGFRGGGRRGGGFRHRGGRRSRWGGWGWGWGYPYWGDQIYYVPTADDNQKNYICLTQYKQCVDKFDDKAQCADILASCIRN